MKWVALFVSGWLPGRRRKLFYFIALALIGLHGGAGAGTAVTLIIGSEMFLLTGSYENVFGGLLLGRLK